MPILLKHRCFDGFNIAACIFKAKRIACFRIATAGGAAVDGSARQIYCASDRDAVVIGSAITSIAAVDIAADRSAFNKYAVTVGVAHTSIAAVDIAADSAAVNDLYCVAAG